MLGSMQLRMWSAMRWFGDRAVVLAVMVAMPLAAALAPQEAQIYRIYDDLAKCLDGTPPAYYFRPGSGSGANKWLLYYEGGGWCGSTDECFLRSWTDLGSSSAYPETMRLDYDMLDSDASNNPLLHDWNMVFVKYCDGSFWTGNRLDTDVFRSKTLYYRGRFNNQALIRDLRQNRGLGSGGVGSEVVVSGCSAGGVQAFVNTDYLASLLPNNTRVVALPDSGFLLAYEGLGRCDYSGHMASTYVLMNSTAALHPQCLRTFPGEPWRCLFFAQHVLSHLQSPVFVLNSRYDSWQIEYLYCGKQEGDRGLVRQRIDAFGQLLAGSLYTSLRSHKDGYVLDSCEHHCGGWNAIRTDDGRSQRQAFEQWYKALVPSTQPPQQQQPQQQQQQQQQSGPIVSGTSPSPAPHSLPAVPLVSWGGNNTAAFPCVACCGGWVPEKDKYTATSTSSITSALRGGTR